jgi:hypothetical protein
MDLLFKTHYIRKANLDFLQRLSTPSKHTSSEIPAFYQMYVI